MQKIKKGSVSRYRVQYRTASGARRSEWFSTRSLAQAFEAKLQEDRERLQAGLLRPLDQSLMVDFAMAWLQKREATMGHSTFFPDEARMRLFWVPRFGHRLLSSIEAWEIQDALDDLVTKGVEHTLKGGKKKKLVKASPASRNRHLALIHKFFEDARRARKIAFNPAQDIEHLPERLKVRKTSYWSDFQTVEAYLAAAYDLSLAYGTFAELLLWSGVRLCEAEALRWSDLDFELRTISIQRIIERSTGTVHERTKGQRAGGSYHPPMFDRVRAALIRWRTVCPEPEGLVFALRGSPGRRSRMTRTYALGFHRAALAASQAPRITFHDMRRTFASNAQKAGFSKAEIQTMLGHSSVSTTERYTRMDSRHVLERAERLNFGGMPGEVSALHGKAGTPTAHQCDENDWRGNGRQVNLVSGFKGL